MENIFIVFFIIIIIWIIVFSFLEILIVNNMKNKIESVFNDLDEDFKLRLKIILDMLNISKNYNKRSSDDLINTIKYSLDDYSLLSINEKLNFNKEFKFIIKKVLFFSEVYPELGEYSKYASMEKKISRCNKRIIKNINKYNKEVELYNKRLNVFTTKFYDKFLKFSRFDLFIDDYNDK